MTQMPSPVFSLPGPATDLVRTGLLDAELAALLSLAVGGGVPVVVAGGAGEERLALREALVGLRDPGSPVMRLAGAHEEFAWMPQAGELGWHAGGPAAPGLLGALMVGDLTPEATWGDAAHLVIRALTAGHSLIASVPGASLGEVLGTLSAPPVGASEDELARLGVVLVLGGGARVAVAHYLRPVARDGGGHVQRLPPAVLATWNAAAARFDHFSWGVIDELAARTGWQPRAFERELARRAAAIAAPTARA